MITVYTVGHSNHPFDTLAQLLGRHAITAVADVRSTPYSRRNPQYHRESLAGALKGRGIAYVYLGEELGARSADPDCYREGRVQYERLAHTALFKSGIARVLDGATRHRVALMCAEKEPLDCHRTLLIARQLQRRGAVLLHILADGSLEAHDSTMNRLVNLLQLGDSDLFSTAEQRIEEACRQHEGKIAFAAR